MYAGANMGHPSTAVRKRKAAAFLHIMSGFPFWLCQNIPRIGPELHACAVHAFPHVYYVPAEIGPEGANNSVPSR